MRKRNQRHGNNGFDQREEPAQRAEHEAVERNQRQEEGEQEAGGEKHHHDHTHNVTDGIAGIRAGRCRGAEHPGEHARQRETPITHKMGRHRLQSQRLC